MNGLDLHPDAAAFLAELAGLRLPPSNGIPIAELRERFRRICAQFAGPRIEMACIEEIAAPAAMRRYVPEQASPGKILVWLHGGRMLVGDLETHNAACRLLAATTRWPVLAVDYRLGPEHPFPAALDDSIAAVEWAAQECDTVAIGGDSAGASLALDAALHAQARPSALILVYPMIDATMAQPSHREFLKGPGTSSEDIAMGYDLWLPENADRGDPRVSPIFARLEGLPPTWLLTAEYDPLRDEGRLLAHRLREAGVRVEFSEAARHVHGFLAYPGRFQAAHDAAGEIARFLGGV